MNIAILQVQLNFSELKQLSKEFPQFLFLSFPRFGIQPISKEHWRRAEILYGGKLTPEDLAEAHQLRWIHTPTPNLNLLCLKEIQERGNILITNSREENYFQIAEFVLSVVLAYAKNLFHWKEVDQFPTILWDCKWRNKMWTLKDKVFLQIGMGKMGIEIARRAHLAGMKVWTMDSILSFHPFSNKQFIFNELHEVLPEVDIVSVAAQREKNLDIKLGSEELSLMKEDSIISILGSRQYIDENALYELSSQGKFRGILLDSYFQTTIPMQSKLWHTPNILITPEVAPRPKTANGESFKIFRFNLRQYLHGNFSDMKNLIDPTLAFVPEFEEMV